MYFALFSGENKGMLAAATAFILLGKIGDGISFNVLFLVSQELYPTNMRYPTCNTYYVIYQNFLAVYIYPRNVYTL